MTEVARVTGVQPLEPYRLRLTFADGAVGTVDLAGHIVGRGGVFGPLNDPAFFRQVRLEPQFGTVVWPNDVDLCPDVLYSELQREDSDGAIVGTTTQQNDGGHARQDAETRAVPEISRFFGIVITMFFDEHEPAHFHADYAEHHIAVQIADGSVRGEFPRRALALVREWASLHRTQLLKNWKRARSGQPLLPIAPLD